MKFNYLDMKKQKSIKITKNKKLNNLLMNEKGIISIEKVLVKAKKYI